MQTCFEQEIQDMQAAEGVSLFCCQIKRWIRTFAAEFGGLDTPVFAGGIGENAPVIRARIDFGLGFLGIDLKEKLNSGSAMVIFAQAGRVTVCVMHTR